MHLHSTLLFLHVLAACIWFGGHMVLSVVILPKAKREQNPLALVEFERSFEKIGMPALLVQILTGPMIALRYAPMSTWFLWQTEAQDHIASKVILLGVILVLAISMRLRVLPRLKAGDASALRSAASHIHTVTFLSFLMIFMGLSLHTGGFAY